MKTKINYSRLFIFVLMLAFFGFLGNRTAQASQCTDQGGSCDYTCNSTTQKNLGALDCPNALGQEYCCKTVASKVNNNSGSNISCSSQGGTCGFTCNGVAQTNLGTLDCPNTLGQEYCCKTDASKTCQGQGGSCETTCSSNQTNLGILDCPPVMAISQTCCKSNTASPGTGTTTPNTGVGTSGASSGIVPCGNGNDVSGACSLCSLIVGIYNIIQLGRNILLTISVVCIFLAGVMYIISAGTGLAEKAKQFLSAAIVGFTVVLTAWLIIATVMWIFSANLGSVTGKSIDWSSGSINFSCNSN